MKKTLFTSTLTLATVLVSNQSLATTLEDVQAKNILTCGVSTGKPGFSSPDLQGKWSGLDIDFCKALATTVFGDAEKYEVKALSGKNRFTALSSGEIDILTRTTTQTFSRDALHGNFIGVNYYDGQGFMVRKDLGVTSAEKLNGAAICTQTGTTTELNAADYFRTLNLEYSIVAFEKADEVISAYDSGRCDVYTGDQSGIAGYRTKLENADEHLILPEVISKEPLGPVVRHGDEQWHDIAKWTLNCLINAEEAGVTAANVDEMANSKNPAIQRLLGAAGGLGEMIGIDNDFCHKVVKQIGNYGESFERNVGPNTPLGLERGLNRLWNQGGIMYAAPAR